VGVVPAANADPVYQRTEMTFHDPVERAFQPFASCGEQEPRVVHDLYAGLPSLDFSKCVLVTAAGRFAVLRLGEIEWSDLGSPARTVNTFHRGGADLPWVQAWRLANPVLTSPHSGSAQAAF
jgi:hypothetical protein